MNSLLVNLKKYRPREGMTPTENFVTEAFAYLLNNVPEVSVHFLFKLSELNPLPEPAIECRQENVEWSTQQNFDGVYPDMFADLGSLKLIFEHKVGASLHQGQLESYRNHAKKYYKNYLLILITRHESQHQQSPDLALCWRDVFNILSPLMSQFDENGKNHWLLSEFLNLLKAEGLGPLAPMSFDAMWHLLEAKKFEKQFNDFIYQAKERTWHGMENFEVQVGRRWGRLGLEFNYIVNGVAGWFPSIFVGILHDPTDHCVRHRNKRGINFVTIISFANKVHSHYQSLNSLTILQKELEQITDKHAVLKFYNHHQDGDFVNQNPYHPLYLEAPLVDVLINTETASEQHEVLNKTIQDALSMVVNSEGFKCLVNELAVFRSEGAF